MIKNQGGKAGDVFGLNLETFLFELLQCCVDVDCVPKDNQSKRSKLILLSFTISLAQLAPLSVEYGSSQFRTLFPFIELPEYSTALCPILDVVSRLRRLRAAAPFRGRLWRSSWPLARLLPS